jgi:hypothetical protein
MDGCKKKPEPRYSVKLKNGDVFTVNDKDKQNISYKLKLKQKDRTSYFTLVDDTIINIDYIVSIEEIYQGGLYA